MSQEQLSPGRLEAFSDGVIAVIITIMVLELKVPGTHDIPNNAAALSGDIKLVLIYLLSFVQVGIYWVNHHYLIDDLDQVSHGILWSNLAFLFCLSLIPFAANWVGERGITPFAVALYAACCTLPAVSWMALSTIICRRTQRSLDGSVLKQVTSATLNLASIFVAYRSTRVALGMLVTVAILWLIPPRRVVQLTKRTPQPESR